MKMVRAYFVKLNLIKTFTKKINYFFKVKISALNKINKKYFYY